jgi:alpha-beta hydrolase superfamily lysophospholipase
VSAKAPDRRRRRLLPAAATLVVVIVLAAGGLLGSGWYFTDQLLTPNHSAPTYNVTVRSVDGSTIELDRTVDTARPGIWGLVWPDGHAIVGALTAIADHSVTRVLEMSTGPLNDGSRVAVSSQVYWADPQLSFGIRSLDVGIPSDVGTLPAWYAPGPTSDFAIVVHGYNATLTDGLREVPVLARLGLTVLLISYRNDARAPASDDRLLHLGDSEWHDLAAAVQWSLSKGARRILLVGISMGGAIVEMFMGRSNLAARVAAVVVDSPVLSWDAVLRFQAERRNLPEILVTSTEQVIRARIGFDVTSYDQVRDASAVRVPTLLFQDGQETFVPPAPAAEFARARPDLVEYHFYADAPHAAEWNLDPAGYVAAVHSFVVRVLGLSPPSP